MHGLKVLTDDLTERDRVDTEFREVAGTRATAGFDSSANSICGPKSGVCAAKEASAD